MPRRPRQQWKADLAYQMTKRSLTLRRCRLPRGLELAGRESRRLEDKRRELPVLRVQRRLEALVPVPGLAPRGLGATGS